MNRTDAPAKQPKPFGVNGQREAILPTTPSGDNTASYESGFPPITMILKSAGGLPPKGQDMNQILFELSALGRWSSTGALNTYDSAFATAIGGYPAGSFVLGDDLKTVYRCTVDGNTGNPNSITTGWSKVASDIADILSLGSAAYRTVGNGANQIPDMSYWSSPSGGVNFPNGFQMRFGTISSSGAKTFSTPFTNQCYGIVFGQTYAANFWVFSPAYRASDISKTGFAFINMAWSGVPGTASQEAGESVFYIAIGF